MALRLRQPRTIEEYTAVLGGIGHYFGGGTTTEGAERFARVLPLERSLGVFDGDRVVAGAGAFPFELSIPGGTLPSAGVTVVGVHPTHRRQGILGRMMRAQLADIRDRGEPIAALWASEETIYGRFGYGLAAQDVMIRASRTHAAMHPGLAGPVGKTRLVDHDEALKIFPRVYERVRRTTPGFLSRSKAWWELRTLDDRPERRRGSGELNRVLLEIDGRPVGYATYRIKFEFEGAVNKGHVDVLEAIGDSDVAVRELWRYLLGIDWIDAIQCELLPADHPLFLLVQRPNRLDWKVFDGLWLRLVDVPTALSARSLAGDGRVTFEVTADPFFADNIGTWTIEDGVARRSRRRADLRLDVQALACAYLGGFTFRDLARAGRVEEVARGGLVRADALYHVPAKPWCPEIF
jgi:predicted acetyltransferase